MIIFDLKDNLLSELQNIMYNAELHSITYNAELPYINCTPEPNVGNAYANVPQCKCIECNGLILAKFE